MAELLDIFHTVAASLATVATGLFAFMKISVAPLKSDITALKEHSARKEADMVALREKYETLALQSVSKLEHDKAMQNVANTMNTIKEELRQDAKETRQYLTARLDQVVNLLLRGENNGQ